MFVAGDTAWGATHIMKEKSLPDLQKLFYFTEVAKHGSFRQAALRLGVDQPLLSRKVQDLELYYGSVLLQRGAKGVTLTEMGAALLAEVQPLLSTAQHLNEVFLNNRTAPTGSVRVALPPSLSERVVPLIVERLNQEFPSIRLHVTEGSPTQILDYLTSGEVDIAVVPAPTQTNLLVEEHLITEEIYLIGKPRGAWSGYVSAEELADTPLVMQSQPHGIQKIVNSMAKKMRIALVPRITVDGPHTLCRLVLKGHYHCILPAAMFIEAIAGGEVVARRFKARPRRRLFIASLRDRPLSFAARMVARTLRLCTKELGLDEQRSMQVGSAG